MFRLRRNLPVSTAFVQEVNVFDEQREERYDHPLALIRGAGAPPQGRLQRRPVTAKVRRRIHVLFQDGEFGRLLYFVPLQLAEKRKNKIKSDSVKLATITKHMAGNARLIYYFRNVVVWNNFQSNDWTAINYSVLVNFHKNSSTTNRNQIIIMQ